MDPLFLKGPECYGDALEASRGVRARAGAKLSPLPATPGYFPFHQLTFGETVGDHLRTNVTQFEK